jgi:putative hydrolase of HD superfamily
LDQPFHRIRQAHGLLALARQTAELKAIPRTGWLDRGVDPRHVESVADHSLGVALFAWACALERQEQGADLDPVRVVMLALIHDLAEAETGDLPPYDPAALPAEDDRESRRAFLDRRHVRTDASAAAKRADEHAVMRRLLDALPVAVRTEMAGYWEELNQGTSAEARFVKQIDRLETFMQSRQYLRNAPDLPMESFRQEVVEAIDDPLLSAIRDAALEDEPTR